MTNYTLKLTFGLHFIIPRVQQIDLLTRFWTYLIWWKSKGYEWVMSKFSTNFIKHTTKVRSQRWGGGMRVWRKPIMFATVRKCIVTSLLKFYSLSILYSVYFAIIKSILKLSMGSKTFILKLALHVSSWIHIGDHKRSQMLIMSIRQRGD